MAPNNQSMNRMNKIILCGLLLCLLGAAGKGYGQEVDIRTDKRYKGLVAAWNFDGDTDEFLSGDTLKVNKGEVVYTMDRNLDEGKALLVQKGQFLSGLNDLLPQGDSARTVMFWLRKTGCGNADIALLQFGNSSKPRGTMNIRVRPCAEWGDYMTTSFVPDLNGKHKYSDALQGEFFSGMWKHIAITYASGIVSAYCNGFPVKKYPPSSKSERADTASAEVALGWTTNPDENDDTAICIDDIRVFASRFNSRKVNSIYEAEMSSKAKVDSDKDGVFDANEIFLHGTDPNKTDTDGDGLSDGYELGSQGRLQVVEGAFNWGEAKKDAEDKGGHLATITSHVENSIVINLLINQFDAKIPSLWLGASDSEKEGNWIWVTGEKWEYQNWDSENGEPNNAWDGTEDYLQIIPSSIDWTAGKWNDRTFTFKENAWKPIGYLLEKGFPSDPGRFDSDGDGYSDGEEFNANTNPIDSSSFPVASANLLITEVQKVPFGFSFTAEQGKSYVVEVTQDFKQWGELVTYKGDGKPLKFTDPRLPIVPFKRNFYRVRLAD